MRARAGAAFHTVDIDDVRTAFRRHAHVVVDARRTELQLDRNFVVGRLANFLDLEREIVGPEPVRVTGRRTLVDAGRERAHFGNLIGYLLAHQVTSKSDLAALTDEELDGICET